MIQYIIHGLLASKEINLPTPRTHHVIRKPVKLEENRGIRPLALAPAHPDPRNPSPGTSRQRSDGPLPAKTPHVEHPGRFAKSTLACGVPRLSSQYRELPLGHSVDHVNKADLPLWRSSGTRSFTKNSIPMIRPSDVGRETSPGQHRTQSTNQATHRRGLPGSPRAETVQPSLKIHCVFVTH